MKHAAQHPPPKPPPLRILVINPNTNAAVTQRVRDVARRFASPQIELSVMNPDHGPLSIESPPERAAAEIEVERLLRSHLDYDAYVLACFDDIALEAARDLVSVPVVATCEAGIRAARQASARFGVVTTVHSAVPGIRQLLHRYGGGSDCSVRAAGIGVAAAASAETEVLDRIVATAQEAIELEGADVILLASGGLTGLADTVAQRCGVPVLDGVACAIEQAVMALRPPT